MASEARPLGLLGGTFDPIHVAHLRLAEEAREALQLEAVRLIPAGQPPHRGTTGASSQQRLAMASLAIEGNPDLQLDPGEVHSPKASYTVATLERLRAELGGERPLVLVLGADAFAGLPSWHRWRDLFGLAHLAIANRPGHAPHGRRRPGSPSPELDAECAPRLTRRNDDLADAPAGRVIAFDMTPLDISATHIRALLGHGRSCRYLLRDAVLDYIETHSLYR